MSVPIYEPKTEGLRMLLENRFQFLESEELESKKVKKKNLIEIIQTLQDVIGDANNLITNQMDGLNEQIFAFRRDLSALRNTAQREMRDYINGELLNQVLVIDCCGSFGWDIPWSSWKARLPLPIVPTRLPSRPYVFLYSDVGQAADKNYPVGPPSPQVNQLFAVNVDECLYIPDRRVNWTLVADRISEKYKTVCDALLATRLLDNCRTGKCNIRIGKDAAKMQDTINEVAARLAKTDIKSVSQEDGPLVTGNPNIAAKGCQS
jgi:hypothetical protein